MKKYDCLVVGAGNSGLVSALSLVNDGYKVLVLEKNNNIGGLSRSLVKGRFEFETSLHNLYLNGTSLNEYRIENILKNNNVSNEINFSTISELCRVITPEIDYTMPLGINKFTKKMEEIVPGSEESIKLFFDLAKESREALDYIVKNKDNVDYDYIKENYNNFMRIASYSVSKVLDTIGMPIKAQEIINIMWIYFGSTETELSFVEYAVFMLNAIEYGLQVPSDRSYDVSLTLADAFLSRGGEIRYNNEVINLLVDDGKINGVKLKDGEIIYANKVIVNSLLSNVYGKLIDANEIPRKALKNINKRELGGRLFSVHLGLNRSAKELGLENYSYIIYQSLDSDVEYNRMKQLTNGNQVAIVHNNAIKNASPAGTCMISLNTVFFDDSFGKSLEKENYYEEIDEIVHRLIEVFEKNTKVRILDYIEEIEIVSPIDNIEISGALDGNTYGYKLTGLDNLLPRLLNSKNEAYIEGLYTCGGFDGDLYGYNSSFASGIDVYKSVKKDIVGDK